jgi:DNA-directed RNA polymerase sigma subunit (sigma70/sigma32)
LDPFDAFMKTAKRYPLLTTKEEILLGRRIQEWLAQTDPSPSVVRSGLRARERFILCNLRLVARVARSFTRSAARANIPMEDVLQEGVLGLTRAAEKYSPTCGYKMSTYAFWWIRQAINRYIESRGHIIHITFRMRKRVFDVERAMAQGGSVDDVATRLGISPKCVRNALLAQACMRTVELDALESGHNVAAPREDDGLCPVEVHGRLMAHATNHGSFQALGLVFTPDGIFAADGEHVDSSKAVCLIAEHIA